MRQRRNPENGIVRIPHILMNTNLMFRNITIKYI